jgi:hypothetical protein
MAVSLLDVLVSGRPDRSPLATVRRGTTRGLLAVTLVLACFAGRPSGRRR